MDVHSTPDVDTTTLLPQVESENTARNDVELLRIERMKSELEAAEMELAKGGPCDNSVERSILGLQETIKKGRLLRELMAEDTLFLEMLTAQTHHETVQLKRRLNEQIAPNLQVSPDRFSRVVYKLLDEAPSTRENKRCSFCFDDFVDGSTVVKLDCAHLYHFECCETLFKFSTKCIQCRRNYAL